MQNVFKDLFPDEDAEILHQKSQLLMRIVKVHRDSLHSGSSLAKRLKVSQPRVSDLLNGHIDKFSLEMLQRMCMRLGLPHLQLA